MRAALATLTMCLFVLPANAKYSGGTGEPNDPYQIATAADLIALGETPADYAKHFILTADINLDPNLPGRKVFDKAPIAPNTSTATWLFEGTPFTGVLDGNGHTISHLTITGRSYVGLFGQLGPEAAIRDLGLLDVNITGSGSRIGALAGTNGDWPARGGIVAKCHSTGSVSGTGWGIGGLVGDNSNGSIATSFSNSSVRGDSSVGGLAGHNYAHITASYSTGSVIGGSSVGGLVGKNVAMIAVSYSSGSVNGTGRVGGLVGENLGNIVTCYSTGSVRGDSDIGGIVGFSRASIEYVRTCVWDADSSGLSASVGGLALTTAEMMDPNTLGLNGFADDPNWVLDAGRDYPRLAWQGTAGAMIAEPNIDWLEGQGTAQSPYKIHTADQLILLGKASILWDRHFALAADIDLDPSLPGRSVFRQALILVFTGVFDGNGHTISHLTIKGGSRLGLCGELGRWNAAGSISHLRLEAVDITGTGSFVGGLLGYTDSHDIYQASIASCCSSGSVSGTSYVGGLVGHSSGRIATSYSTSSVGGTSSIGGLAGSNSGSIASSYSIGSVTGANRIGGLVGENWLGSIATSYSTGAVSGTEYIGGLVGNDYHASVTASLWDIETSGQTTSQGGTGRTTAEMQTGQTFLNAGWDFVGETANGTEDIWWIDEGKDYPRLWWELIPEN